MATAYPCATEPFGQMRPVGFVEAHPIAAMHEDDQALRRLLGQEQIETVALTVAIGEVELRAPCPASFAR